MFNWIHSWFTQPVDRLDVYTPAERKLYSYFNGEKTVIVDPMVLYKKLQKWGPDIESDLKLANFPGAKNAVQAQDNVLKLLRGIFEIKEYKDGGLTEAELLALMDHFLTYCGAVKKKVNHSQTSPTVTSDMSNSSSDAVQPTSNSLDSGSTVAESKADAPMPSQSV